LSNLNNINKNDDELIFFDEEKGIYSEIPLKSGIPPAENANIYFSKYKKYKNSKNVLEKKLLSVNKEIEYLKNEIKMTEELEQIEKPKKENKKEQEDSYKNKFRIFKLDENNEVWVGKSSESNDLLTFKYSNPEDIWFHVRGFSGSHTVLRRNNKKENIDRKFLESAAAIAAYYSKARNAGTVPVAYCERKYVKKRKGFKQGTVIMEREKLIYTKPRLPGN
jgi:predicted ribosome quality control (RQC) complex YloA/Tae2 family protein